MNNDSEQRASADNAAPLPAAHEVTLLAEDDIFLFNEGSHFRLYDKLGAHVVENADARGTYFAVWAPNAVQVSVMGDFNDWDKTSQRLHPRGQSGIWEGFVPGVGQGLRYKYHIRSQRNDYQVDKADPFAFFNQIAPETASVIWDLEYPWQDEQWRAQQGRLRALRERQTRCR